MKSTLIGFLVLTSSVFMFAETSSIVTPNRGLQALKALTQADVASQITLANAAATSALQLVISATTQAQVVATLASQANIELQAALAAASAVNIAQSNQENLINNLQQAQSNQQSGQAALQTTYQTVVGLDAFFIQATAVLTAQTNAGSASGSPAALTAASILVTSLYNNMQNQQNMALLIDNNVTAIANMDPTVSTAIGFQVSAAQTQQIFTDYLYSKLNNKITQAIAQAQTDSLKAVSNPSVSNSATAITSVSLALAALAPISAYGDSQLAAAIASQNTLFQAANTAYTAYTTGLTTLSNAVLAQTLALTKMNTSSLALNASLILLQGNSSNASISVISANLIATGSLYTSSFFSQQCEYQCSELTNTLQNTLDDQVISCAKQGRTASAKEKATASKACSVANTKVSKANQKTTFSCQNLSSYASVSSAVNVTIDALSTLQTQALAATQTQAAVTLSNTSLPLIFSAQTKVNLVSTTQMVNLANQLIAANFNLQAAQAIQSTAQSMASIYDILFGLTYSAQNQQNQANNAVTWGGATPYVLQLQQAYILQASQAGAIAANASSAAVVALNAAGGNNTGNLVYATQSQIATAQATLFSAQNALFTPTALIALNTAYANSLLAKDLPSSKTAINSVNAALTVVQVFAAAADLALVNANSALQAANGAVQVLQLTLQNAQNALDDASSNALQAVKASADAVSSTLLKINDLNVAAQASISSAAASALSTNTANLLQSMQIQTAHDDCTYASTKITIALDKKIKICKAMPKSKKAKKDQIKYCAAAIEEIHFETEGRVLACPK